MVDHIYGRKNIISRTDRPNMFIKELNLYLNYFEEKIKNISNKLKAKDIKFFTNFTKNLEQGIQYYNSIIKDSKSQKLLSKAEYKFIEVKQILNNHL
jgi:phosphoribosyl-dephospho-CoA transferase